MTESRLQVLRLAGLAAALLLALAWQRVAPHGRRRGSPVPNVELWLLDIAVTGAACGACACTVARWAQASGTGLFHRLAAPYWVEAVAAVLLLDLVSYGWHRANHVVPFLWRWHMVHHSDADLSVSTALRFHPGELLLSLPVRLAAVAALGVAPETVVLFEVVFALANVVEHGNIRMPARVDAGLARVLVTPALHRWHHHRERRFRDRNFGTIFSFWDRAFGTFAPNDSATAVPTGLPGMAGGTFSEALALPFRRGRR